MLEFRSDAGQDEKLRVTGLGDFPAVVAALPRIHEGDGTAARELLRRELNTLHGQDNVAFCTAQVSSEVIELLLSFKLHKRNPLLFLVVPPAMNADEVRDYTKPLRRLDEAQIPCFVFDAASKLGVEEDVHA